MNRAETVELLAMATAGVAWIVLGMIRRNLRARSQGENFIDAINPVTGQAFTWCPSCRKAGPAHAFYCGRCGWFMNPK